MSESMRPCSLDITKSIEAMQVEASISLDVQVNIVRNLSSDCVFVLFCRLLWASLDLWQCISHHVYAD